MATWELIHKIVRNLGRGWGVDASGLQDLGHYAGLASGPDDMRLFFIARTEKLDPCMERICPPLGWLRVDGRLHFNDEDLSAKLSIMLRESLSPEEMANEITNRLLHIYREFLSFVAKYNLPNEEVAAELQGGTHIELDWQRFQQELGPEKFAQVEQLGKRVFKVREKILDTLYDNGIASRGKRDPHSLSSEPPESVQDSRQKTMTEQQAASFFVCFLLEESTRTWPSTHEALKASLGSKFVVEDEKTASFNWCLAAISLGLQGVRNTFVPEQAGKLEKWIFMSMTDWAVDEVKRYDAAFQKGFKWIFVDMNDQCRTFDKLKPEAEAAAQR